jgi:16S rRNA processing protein RimM
MISKDNLVGIGYIQRSHGYQGNIQIKCTKEIALNKGDFLFLLLDGLPVPFQILSSKGKGDQPVLALEFVNSHEYAQRLIGTEVFLNAPEIPTESELSYVGYHLVDKKLSHLGDVQDVIQLPHQTLFLIEYNGKECYVPFIETFVEHISHDEREIWLNLPDGLMDL